MAEDKKSFVGYNDWESTFNLLTDEEAGKLIKHFFAYVNDKEPILDDRLLQISFEPIKLQLKRDLKKYETVRKKRSESGKKGGLKSAELKQNQAKEASASSAIENKANQAVTDTVTVNVNDTDILLKKETKDTCEVFETLEDENSTYQTEEEKEKSSAKKEKDLADLKESEFFEKVCDYFSQTHEEQKMKVFGEMVRIYDQNQIEEFQKQTEAYMEFKNLSGQEIHGWQNYASQWKSNNWIDKLEKLKSKNGKSNNQAGRSGTGNISGRAKVIASGNITEFT